MREIKQMIAALAETGFLTQDEGWLMLQALDLEAPPALCRRPLQYLTKAENTLLAAMALRHIDHATASAQAIRAIRDTFEAEPGDRPR